MVAIGSDHGGFELKEAIKKYLEKQNIRYKDFGTNSNESVNYAPIALKVGKSIINYECEKGILCCGTGIGISIAANKIKGIRAAVCTNEFCAEMTRRHNDSNILCMGGRVINIDMALKLTKIFLNTEFDAGRHKERIGQISQIENNDLLKEGW